MINDNQFMAYVKDAANRRFTGWDFSALTETGRMQMQLLSWSYGSRVIPLMQKASSLLDMGTGGGECLSGLSAFFPETVYATEGYKPNVALAINRLEPLGVEVVQVEEDSKLPFDNAFFDLIINRHESYSASEVRRIISEHGLFVTQQSGGTDCLQINEALGVPLNEEFDHWNLDAAMTEIQENGFRVLESKEEFPIQRFYDIGALVYYLQVIPWQVPQFEWELYLDPLYEIHRIIEVKGYFDVNQHRFIIKAEAI